jgi:hypothetical protein
LIENDPSPTNAVATVLRKRGIDISHGRERHEGERIITITTGSDRRTDPASTVPKPFTIFSGEANVQEDVDGAESPDAATAAPDEAAPKANGQAPDEHTTWTATLVENAQH